MRKPHQMELYLGQAIFNTTRELNTKLTQN